MLNLGALMKKLVLTSLSALLIFLSFTAFQCASTELTSAKLYIQQKKYDKAQEVLQKEIQKNPQSDEGHYLLGHLYGEQANYAKMNEHFAKSLETSNRFAENIKSYRQNYWANEFNKGVNLYNRAGKVTSQDSSKNYFLKASDAFRNAVIIMPDSSASYQNLSFTLRRAGEDEKAVQIFEDLNKTNKSAATSKMLADNYLYVGQKFMDSYKENGNAQDSVKAMSYFNNAVTMLEEETKNNPNDNDLLVLLSSAYISAKKTDVALNTFKAVVEKNPENAQFRYNYGVLLLEAKDFTGSVEQFEKAIEIDPKFESALYNLSVAYLRWGSELRNKAEENKTTDPAANQKFEGAMQSLERLVEINPNEVAYWETLAKVYALLGKNDQAKDAFDKADSLR